MNPQLTSVAEQRALAAQELQCFSRFNLLGTKIGLETLLAQIGRDGIFASYTKHDISHIDTLLHMLDWVVVDDAVKAMNPTDWMLAVLAIYFHDAGLVVTAREFEDRNQSRFPEFRHQALSSPGSSAYRERVESLAKDAKERFLYQEFVRTYHAQRVKRWIEGTADVELGVAAETASTVHGLLSELDENFRNDLAMVCESHHLDDLGDLAKYNLRRAYGNDMRETANLQFGAILLRTVDLLHVTRDRAPSLAFRMISPADPKSIEEWHKQMDVVSVRSALPRDDKGNVDKTAMPDTISVSATFKDPLGFFSLTEYLAYTEAQLRQSNQWAEESASREASDYLFPWRKIDTAQIRAVGFESRQFSFQLDKPKILKLLTGHTLYNNADVVVRELAQNSLDATRLQATRTSEPGQINLALNTVTRVMTVDDNGTGMTQQVIEAHFLNVGSSLYSDEEFRKRNPSFSAISRFGIGILSTFMISDEIEVLTKAQDEKLARNLSIRSLNGKYLIRLVDPSSADVPDLMKAHGTRIQLRLRADARMPNLEQIARHWILFPECDVNVRVDDGPIVKIGFSSPKEALETVLTYAGYTVATAEPDENSETFKVVQEKRDGLVLAYAMTWQPFYKNWAFAGAGRINRGQQAQLMFPTALCIHGVRVENTSPGFAGQDPLAISNITGPRSPATNVARSSLEVSPLIDEMFSKVYGIYAGHISAEIHKMCSSRGLSISTAASEGRYIINTIQGPVPLNQCPNAASLRDAQLKTIPCLTMDDGDTRKLISLAELTGIGGFWTAESSAYRSAEELMRRIPSAASIAILASLLGAKELQPKGSLIGGYSENLLVRELFHSEFEVDEIEILRDARQVNMHWNKPSTPPSWKSIRSIRPEVDSRVSQFLQQHGRETGVTSARYRALVLEDSSHLPKTGVDDECGVKTATRTYIFKGNPVHDVLTKSLNELEAGDLHPASYAFAIILVNMALTYELAAADHMREIEVLRQTMSQEAATEIALPEDLRALVAHPPAPPFDPLRGERSVPYGWGYGAPID